MNLIMKILLHNEYKIINLWYPTYVYQFLNFPYNYKYRLLACFETRPEVQLLVLAFGSPRTTCEANSSHSYSPCTS